MKKTILIMLMLFGLPLFAAVLTDFTCTPELGSISWEGIQRGSYASCIANMPERKTDIDDSIRYRITELMTNAVLIANTMATTATNKSITIPSETWDYINAHLPPP